MYRNAVAVLSTQGVEIDEGNLWSKDANLMVLQDDDQYITAEFSDAFYEVD